MGRSVEELFRPGMFGVQACWPAWLEANFDQSLATYMRAALAVAQFRQSPYWIAYLTQYLRMHCGVDNHVLVEIAGAAMHYVSFNRIAHGMRLEPPCFGIDESDVGSGGRFEQLVPGVRKRLSPST
jgi:hypothetical protein